MCIRMYIGRNTYGPNLKFENPKSRSKPFNLFSILKCAWRPNFTFFWNFFIIYWCVQNCCFRKILDHWKTTILKNYKINSNKFSKNVKFGLQVYFNIDITMNGSDRLFEFWNFKFGPYVFRPICFQKYISHSLSLSLYIYIEVG